MELQLGKGMFLRFRHALDRYELKRLTIFLRDEIKQCETAQRFSESTGNRTRSHGLYYAREAAGIQIAGVAIPPGDDPHFYLRIPAAFPEIR